MKYFKGKFRKAKKAFKDSFRWGRHRKYYQELAEHTKPGALIGHSSGFNARVKSISEITYFSNKSCKILCFAVVHLEDGSYETFPGYTLPRTLEQIYFYWESWLGASDDEWGFKAIAKYILSVRGTEQDVVDANGVLLISTPELRERAIEYEKKVISELHDKN